MGFWEIQLAGEWKSLGRQIGLAANSAKAKGAPQIAYKNQGQEYILDFATMTQINRASGKSRPVRCKGAERVTRAPAPAPAPVIIHAPAPAPAPVPSAPPAPPAPKKSGPGFGTGVATGVVATGAAGVGIALAVGAIDLGDITDAACAAGDAIVDVAADTADAIADAAADVADLM